MTLFSTLCFASLSVASLAAESSLESKLCVRDALAATGAASYEACSITTELDALDGRVTVLESMPKSKTNWEEHVALVRMHDSHGTEDASVYYKTTTPDNAYEDLRTKVTEAMSGVFTNALGGMPEIRAMLDNPTQTIAIVSGDWSLGAAFAAARQSNAILMLDAKFQTPNPTVMPTNPPTDPPTKSPTTPDPTPSPTETPEEATNGPYDWGSLGSGVHAVYKAFDAPTEPTQAMWTAACAEINLTPAHDSGHPGDGGSYNSDHTSQGNYQKANHFYVNHVRPTLSSSEASTFYNNVIMMQGNNDNCWAYNANVGSMHAFGGTSGSGYSYCRRTGSASECPNSDPRGEYCKPVMKYHIYLCD